MRKLVRILIAVTMAFAACTPKQQSDNSIKITAELRPEINYVTHLYTLTGLL